jgi:glycosyltransferase involved in cell wall biosynthesis
MPFVSVIIPVHNRQSLVIKTLESVINQTFTDWECIVVDDHSSDGTLESVERFTKVDSRFRVVKLPDDKRYLSSARNYGFELAEGDFINFLDSDDILLPDKLQIQVNELICNPDLDVVTCQNARITENGLLYLKYAKKQYWLDIAWFCDYTERYGGLWDPNGPLWRKASIISIGGWDDKLRAWHDVEMNIRAMLSGLRIERIEKVLVHCNSIGNNRMSTPTIERADHLQKAVLVAWKHLVNKGQVTELRRKMISFRLYSVARISMTHGQITKGIYYWISGGFSTKQKMNRIICGLILLLGSPFRHMQPLLKPFKAWFRSPLNYFPDGISSS